MRSQVMAHLAFKELTNYFSRTVAELNGYFPGTLLTTFQNIC